MPQPSDNRAGLTIRPAKVDDLAALDEHLPPAHSPTEHRDRIRAQYAGEVEYLTAWRAAVPVGHVVLRWGGFRFGPLPARFPGIPVFLALRVSPALRGRGIGSALVAAVERSVIGRGYRGLGLGVEVDNSGARSLYQRLGYGEWDGGPLCERRVRLDSDGKPRPYDEVFTIMTKRLGEK